MKKLAIIHTTPVTIPAMQSLIKERTDEMAVMNFLDDSMLPEINAAGHMTDAVQERLVHLMKIAELAGADAVLSACSSIGKAVEEAAVHTNLPVFRVDAPMAEAAAQYDRIGVAATLQSTIDPTTELILRKANENGRTPQVESVVIEGVGSLLSEGRGDEYDRIVNARLKELARNNDIVVLAQASMARAIAGLSDEEKAGYLTSPVSGVESVLKKVCG